VVAVDPSRRRTTSSLPLSPARPSEPGRACFDFFKTNPPPPCPYFAIPLYVDFLDALPRNGIGRVMKAQIACCLETPLNWDPSKRWILTVANEERR